MMFQDFDSFRDRLHEIAVDAVRPRAAGIDADGLYPEDVYRRFAAEGLLALSLPPELGGPEGHAPRGIVALTHATEVMAQYSGAAGLMLLLSRLPAAFLLLAGTPEQRRERLIPLGQGRSRGSFCMSEPQAGSDVLGVSTRAEPDGDGWLLSGHKSWISGAAEADWYVVVATTADPAERRPDALRAFIVDRDAPGLSLRLHPRSSVRGMSLGDIELDRVRVPGDAVLPGITGLGPLLRSLATMRPVVAARGLGLAEAALMHAVRHAETREVNGVALIRQQGIQWELARAAADVEAARLLTYRAADLVESGAGGPDSAGQLAVAKLHATECAVRVSGLATQIFGAAGSVAGHPAERFHRDARNLTVVEGTSEIQLGIIARGLQERHMWWGPKTDRKVVRQ
ncbi:acyl-CoA dehydrogenase family protein [Streptosporangium sp. NPDC049644]|uniref:acyl-CoA dehydrogenase family protein n=1 Tax=Streptosporangium sp. NPDC049644 TaxID=3155507 RepID=UPI00343C2960